MSTITLEAIKTEQNKITEMIAAFVAQAKRLITFPATDVRLDDGEHYAGIILGADGVPSHHLILLPGEAESVNWKNAHAFAYEAGGELPTRCEQSLLFSNCKEQFKGEWYWSSEQHASGSDCAWVQGFDNGGQYDDRKGDTARARAVRRLPL